jgi:hypothetical protein
MKIPLRHDVAERRSARSSDDARRLGARSARRRRILRLLARLAPPTARPSVLRPEFGTRGAEKGPLEFGESISALPAPQPAAHCAPRRNLGRAWATRMITGSAAGRRPLSPGLWI